MNSKKKHPAKSGKISQESNERLHQPLEEQFVKANEEERGSYDKYIGGEEIKDTCDIPPIEHKYGNEQERASFMDRLEAFICYPSRGTGPRPGTRVYIGDSRNIDRADREVFNQVTSDGTTVGISLNLESGDIHVWNSVLDEAYELLWMIEAKLAYERLNPHLPTAIRSMLNLR